LKKKKILLEKIGVRKGRGEEKEKKMFGKE
jgi:hypothetical protein